MFCRLKRKFVPESVRSKYLLQSYYCQEDNFRTKKTIPTFVGPPVDLIDQLLQRGFPPHNLCMELACGTGEFLLQQASQNVEQYFLGVDCVASVLQRAMLAADRSCIKNVQFFCGTAFDCFAQIGQNELFSEIWINFPDPWPKKSHHKRRLLQPDLITQICKKMKNKGFLTTATDHQSLYNHHVEVISAVGELKAVQKDQYTTVSRYHQKALNKRQEIYYTFHQKDV